MSRLWRDRVLVALAPDAVSWVRVRGALKPRAVACGEAEADPAHGNEPWAGALSALRAAAEAWRNERVAVTVVLSNHFVRYALVDPPPRGVSAEEGLALARFHFTRLHGERVQAWDVRVAPAKRGSPQVASAIDRALLAALEAVFAKPARARLVSVQPYLMSAYNRWRERFEPRGTWLVLPEPGRVCLALLAGETWGAVQSARSTADAPHDWLALLDREAQRTAIQPVPATVLARAATAADADAVETPWRVVTLHPPSLEGIPDADRERYAMALHAA